MMTARSRSSSAGKRWEPRTGFSFHQALTPSAPTKSLPATGNGDAKDTCAPIHERGARQSRHRFKTPLRRSAHISPHPVTFSPCGSKTFPHGSSEPCPRTSPYPDATTLGAMAGPWFVPVSWELQDGEAVVIEYEIPPGAPYVGICLTNQWSEMMDIETRQTSLNLAQSQIDNRRVRILLSTKDFGVPNWLDARGYRSGVVTWRASTPDQPATPTVTVIRTDQIDEYFAPAKRVSDQDRAAAMLARLRHFAERNTP